MIRLDRILRCAALLLACLMPAPAFAQANFTAEELDQMMAPVALYPDSLLSQVLMASTYPDEFAAAANWSKAHPDAKGDDAVKSVEKEGWDPSVASLVAFPEVLVSLAAKPQDVKAMGDAFLAQPEDVMTSVQRLRAAAQKAGNLKSNEQIKVSSEPAQKSAPAPAASAPAVTQTIIIEPAQPQVVYVPAYNPTYVYGPWWWPAYPPYYYPYPPGYWWSRPIATGLAWGAAIGVTNALWGGVNWGHGDVNINVNRYNNINVNNRINADGGRQNWAHDSGHRKADYRGGDATKQKLDQKRASTGREQYRGKDADRDASRQRAEQAMRDRGVDPGKGSAADRAKTMERDPGAQRAAGNADRSRDAARNQAQSMDRDAARQRSSNASHDNALRGAGDANARAEMSRGNASMQKAASHGGGARASSGAQGGGARASAGGHGGGARGGGGGGRGGGGRR